MLKAIGLIGVEAGEKMNEDLQVEKLGNYLEGKKIALCVCGGIAAIESPKIARHLRRYGADVRVYVTNSALKFIGEASLEWATGKSVVKELSGLAEHICTEDLILVAPATLNTINKIYSGIADDAVTTLIASALGRKTPVVIAPTMHISLYHNPVLKANLKKNYVHLICPRLEENKAKIPKVENIVAEVSKIINKKVKFQKILITGGPTPGMIDNTRLITNIFRGALAVEMAKEAYHLGYDVSLLIYKSGIQIPDYLNVVYHKTYEEYYKNVFTELNEREYDAAIFSAAVSDYIPDRKHEGKLPSDIKLEINFKPTKKIIKEVREKYPDLFMVTFKHEANISEERLFKIARERTKNYQIVVANREEDMKDQHKAFIVKSELLGGEIIEAHSKREIAEKLIKEIENQILIRTD